MEKIKQLLTDGVLTIEEVLEYAETYQRAMDAFDDAQIDKYYSEEYGDDNIPDYPQEYIDEMNAKLDEEEMYYGSMHSSNPTYIVASTLRHEEETLIFESDENGVITSRDDYSGIAARWVPGIDWTDSDLAVTTVFGKDVFERISDVMPHERGYYVRYKRINIVNP